MGDSGGVIGVLTGGGDCPGLNAVIRAVVKAAIQDHGMRVVGFRDGYHGLVVDESMPLADEDVSGIITHGGTILGTSNRHDPFRWRERNGDGVVESDRSNDALAAYRKHGLHALVCIGGDGTMAIAAGLVGLGMDIVGVPKTIDNDLHGTDLTFGFDSAAQTATEAIDKLHDTAQSHHRVMIAEVMGRYAGWLALQSGVAAGGDVILMPEIPYDVQVVTDFLEKRSRRGKRFSIVVVAEGARPQGGDLTVALVDKTNHDPMRLGGIGYVLARQIEESSGLDTRVTVIGHVQRGGTPTSFDRVLSTRFGAKAAGMISEGRFGRMAALRGWDITDVAIQDIAGKVRTVPSDHPLIAAARSVGTCFGQ
jgi:6-phosphofructokinase 1